MVNHVLLAGLPERQSIHGERVAEALESIELSAEREGQDVAFDLRTVLDGVDPVRDELRVSFEPVLACEPERGFPRVSTIGERAGAVLQRHVLADRVALVAVDPSLALLEVDRIVREIPVDDDVAVGVEVEPFLPDRRADQDERPIRRVEPLAQLRGSRGGLAVGPFTAAFLVAKAHGERGVKPLSLGRDRVLGDFEVAVVDPRRPQRESPDHRVGDRGGRRLRLARSSRPRIP